MFKKYIESFFYSLGTAIYIVLVGIFMQNAESWFGDEQSVITIVLVLILFTLSALVVGGLLVGKPIMLYIDGKKKDAVLMLVSNIGWMLLFFLVALLVLVLV